MSCGAVSIDCQSIGMCVFRSSTQTCGAHFVEPRPKLFRIEALGCGRALKVRHSDRKRNAQTFSDGRARRAVAALMRWRDHK